MTRSYAVRDLSEGDPGWLASLSIAQLGAGFAAGRWSPVEVLAAVSARIDEALSLIHI